EGWRVLLLWRDAAGPGARERQGVPAPAPRDRRLDRGADSLRRRAGHSDAGRRGRRAARRRRGVAQRFIVANSLKHAPGPRWFGGVFMSADFSLDLTAH